MPTMRHIIVCEGESERNYLQRLQTFLDAQPVPCGGFQSAVQFLVPEYAVVMSGEFGKIVSSYRRTFTANKRAKSIKVWADFDLYHRNDSKCAEKYAAKHSGIPDFHFSFHNFEDFFALHFDGNSLAEWLRFGGLSGHRHFTTPLHSTGYLPEIRRIFPAYTKCRLPADFISWASLRNLRDNLSHQPTSNPHILHGIGSFGEFLIHEIEQAYPDFLNLAPSGIVSHGTAMSP